MSNKYKLPDGFVEDGLKKAKGCLYMGVQVEDLSKDELLACLVATSLAMTRASHQYTEDLHTLR